MRAGRLDRRITLQRKWSSYSESGEPQDVWVTLGTTGESRPASITTIPGVERYAIEQFVGKEQVEFRLRWSADIADVSALDRIIYPASSAADSPVPTRAIYNIMDTGEIGRREGLWIRAARQADVYGAATIVEGSGQAGGSG